MNNQDKQLLLGLGVVGLALWLAKKSRDRNMSAVGELRNEEYNDGRIGGIPIGYRTMGLITSSIARRINQKNVLPYKVKAGPIVSTEMFEVHAKRGHNSEHPRFDSYHELYDFERNVIGNFNQIRLGSDGSLLLVEQKSSYQNKPIYDVVAVQMNADIDDEGKYAWNVHTAYRTNKMNKSRVLLWKKK